MSPKSSTLLHIYDKITMEKCSYCFLCFRTDRESKLKAPQPHLKTTTSLSKLEDINNKPPQICYMCEALAVAAAKFRKAAFFATSIDMLFKSMMQSDEYQNEVRRLLDKDGPIDPKELEEHRTLFLDEEELTVYRKNMQLQHTKVIVIDSNDVFTNEPNASIRRFTITPDPLNTTEISDESNSEMEIQDVSVESDTDDVIILDDDTPPPIDKTINRPPPRPLSRTQSLNAPKTDTRKHLIKKKHLKGKAKNMAKVDDIIKDAVIDNAKTPSLVPIERLLKDPEPVVVQNKTLGYLHPIVNKPDGSQTVPSLSVQIIDGQLMIFQNPNEMPKPIMIENNSLIVPTAGVSDLDAENEDISDVVDKLLVEKLEGMRKSKTLEKVVVDDENKVMKQPLMKTDRIDWEDKIPMDVISFVDATDPNPPSYIQPLMPPITNVRSLKQEDEKNNIQTHVRNRRHEDFIDLC